MEHELHKKKMKFYELKRKYRKTVKKTSDLETIVMDYQRNIPVPKITTNYVYYLQQFVMHVFNVHVFADDLSIFYTYDETVVRNRADYACSVLEHNFLKMLDPKVRKLVTFCDSCVG